MSTYPDDGCVAILRTTCAGVQPTAWPKLDKVRKDRSENLPLAAAVYQPLGGGSVCHGIPWYPCLKTWGIARLG